MYLITKTQSNGPKFSVVETVVDQSNKSRNKEYVKYKEKNFTWRVIKEIGYKGVILNSVGFLAENIFSYISLSLNL